MAQIQADCTDPTKSPLRNLRNLRFKEDQGMEVSTDKVVRLREGDDVGIAVAAVKAGEVIGVNGAEIRAQQDIPAGHKVALRQVAPDEPVHKYGQIIGFATKTIEAGGHVHVQNLGVKALSLEYEYSTAVPKVDFYPEAERRTFQGYKRPNGKVGTRNYLAIVSTVNCSASVSKYIAERFRGDALKAYPNVDGVIAFTHKSGCGMNIRGEDLKILERTLAGHARHANVAGYIVCGLGCEVNQASAMIEKTGLISLGTPTKNPTIVTIQEEGGIPKTVERGIREIANLLPYANSFTRTTQPLSELFVATNCGGSDGNSGITANPAVGWMTDEMVRHGGTSVLAETSETYGAEHILTKRAVTPAVGKKLVALMRWWEDYTSMHGAEIDNNPSPGNKAGGLTTIYEKSLGALAKGGTGPLVDVVGFSEPITKRGFVFMDTPGHDPVSITGLVAGGCNVIVFTTGRGSVFGYKPAPSIKVATNTPLYEHMGDDMDINAGVILQGASVEDVGRIIFEKVIAVGSGEKSKSEIHGMGDEEFSPWMLGAVL
jgi:altronate hydrolase